MRKIFLIGFIFACAGAWAIPAKRDGRMMRAVDGTEKMVYMHGNEDMHYLTDEAGVWLDEETLLPMTEEAKRSKLQVKSERMQRRAAQQTGIDRLLAPKGPVILVNFSDTVFTYSKASMVAWATAEDFHEDGATGSIREYFYDASFGQYNLQLDFYGPVTVSKSQAYYGKNNGNGNDMHPGEMVAEACRLAHDSCGLDFSQYDYNNDGEVDWVVVVYAGKGEADSYITNTIWPHQYMLSYTGEQIKLDGKWVNRYCCTNEIDGTIGGRAGIGVFVHEFSHILGLPDLYPTNNGNHKTLTNWDIMDYGVYNNDLKTPPMYSAYERWWMGWMTPTHLTQPSDVTVLELNAGQGAGYLTENGTAIDNILSPYPTVFYMLENRQQSGWDEYIPGHGLLITKVNYKYNWWSGNTVNNSANNMGVDILEADGLTPDYDKNHKDNGYFGKQGDAYPYQNVTSFTQVTNYQLTDITETNGVITFKLNGGGEPTVLSIEEAKKEHVATKILRNGQVVIVRGNKEYTILGYENHQL